MKKEEIEQAAREYSTGKSSSDVFREAHETDFIAGANWALQSENERLKAEMDYWKTKCELTEDCLEKSPCDPDITSEQIEAWQTYHRFIKEFGVLPPKQSCPQCKTEYTKEELLTNEHCFKCGFEMKGF